MQRKKKKKSRIKERERKILISCSISLQCFPWGPLLFAFSFETSPIGSYLKERIKWLATLNQYGNFNAYFSDFLPTLQPPDLDKGGRAYSRIQCQHNFPQSPVTLGVMSKELVLLFGWLV